MKVVRSLCWIKIENDVIGLPLSTAADQATCTSGPMFAVVTVSGASGMNAQSSESIVEGSESPYSFRASITNS